MVFLSQFGSISLSIISAFGVVFFAILGVAFRNHVGEFTLGKHVSPDPDAAGLNMYLASAVYFGIFVFSFCQAAMHSRNDQAEER
jgi:hypothetical protein